MATTLSQLRSRVRYLIDETGTPVTWTNAELNQHINDAQRVLWTTLGYGVREATAALVQGQLNYALPSDILGFSVRSLYCYTAITSTWYRVRRGTVEEVVAEGTDQDNPPRRYTVLDEYIQLGPPPDSTSYTMHIYYHRAPTTLSADGDNMEADDDHAELISVEAAIRALKRVNRDANALRESKAQLVAEALKSNEPDDIVQAKPAWKY